MKRNEIPGLKDVSSRISCAGFLRGKEECIVETEDVDPDELCFLSLSGPARDEGNVPPDDIRVLKIGMGAALGAMRDACKGGRR